MKRNRVAVGQLTTAHSFLLRVCRDENCLAEVRPKMVEKLQGCVRQVPRSCLSVSVSVSVSVCPSLSLTLLLPVAWRDRFD